MMRTTTQQIVSNVVQELPAVCGKGRREHEFRPRRCFAKIFLRDEILSTVRRELPWSHVKTLNPNIQLNGDNVYIKACRRPASADFSLHICDLLP